MLASYHGHAPLVKLLLENGADPNSLNNRKQSPLAGAVFKGEDEVVEVSLLDIVPSSLRISLPYLICHSYAFVFCLLS
jgi:ankyrin repeat protein